MILMGRIMVYESVVCASRPISAYGMLVLPQVRKYMFLHVTKRNLKMIPCYVYEFHLSSLVQSS